VAGSRTLGEAGGSRNLRQGAAAAIGNLHPGAGSRTPGAVAGSCHLVVAGSCRPAAGSCRLVVAGSCRPAGAGSCRLAGADSWTPAGVDSCRPAAGSCHPEVGVDSRTRVVADSRPAVGSCPAGEPNLRGEAARHRACPRRARPRAPLVGSYSRHHALRQGQEYRSTSRAHDASNPQRGSGVPNTDRYDGSPCPALPTSNGWH